jgi:hypothetical protein
MKILVKHYSGNQGVISDIGSFTDRTVFVASRLPNGHYVRSIVYPTTQPPMFIGSTILFQTTDEDAQEV